MEPLITATLLNAGANAVQQGIGAVAQAIDGGHSARKQARYQQQLNQQQALWNKENITDPNFQMENAEWNRRFAAQNEQWLQQQQYLNEYNSPTNQVKRLREAGINPAGIGQIQSPMAQGADVSAPYAPQAAGYAAQSAVSQNWEQASLMRAQTANINADTKRKEAETTRQNIENSYLDNWWSGQLAVQNADVQLKRGMKDLTKAQESEVKANQLYIEQKTTNAAQELENLKESMALTSQQILNLKSQKTYQDKVNEYFNKNQDAMIKEIYSRTRANYASEAQAYAQAKQAVEIARKYQLDADFQSMENALSEMLFNDKYISMRAKYNADTNTFNLQSHNTSWLDREELYKAGRKLDDLVKYSEWIKNTGYKIGTTVDLLGIKVSGEQQYQNRNEGWQYTAGQWGSSGR